MKTGNSRLEIHIYGIDGSLRTFVQHDSDLVQRTLAEFNPAHLFCQDRIVVVDDDSRAKFLPPLVTRVDLITAHFSVWDFPFSIGAPHEWTVHEFRKQLRQLPAPERNGFAGESTVLLDLETVDGRHTYLAVQTIAGLARTRLSRIYSIFKQRRLVFGLRPCGIGILNMANLLHFSVHPDILHDSSKELTQGQVPAVSSEPAPPDPWDGGKWNTAAGAEEAAALESQTENHPHATPNGLHRE